MKHSLYDLNFSRAFQAIPKILKVSGFRGDTVGYSGEQYLVSIAKFVYPCTENWVSLDVVIFKLRAIA